MDDIHEKILFRHMVNNRAPDSIIKVWLEINKELNNYC